MRTQTIAGLFDGQDLLAEPVDPTGWLAAPAVADGKPASGSAAGLPVGQQDATAAPDAAGWRADGRQNVRTAERSTRRTGRVRHLRRVRTESLRTGLVTAAPVRQRSGRAVDLTDGVDTQVVSLPTGAAAAARDATEGYQMGRWARLTLTVTVLAAIVVVVSLTAGSAPKAVVDVTVAPGDSLWSIATQAAPDRDPRDVIDEIRELNDVPGGVLPIGVVLRVPVAAG